MVAKIPIIGKIFVNNDGEKFKVNRKLYTKKTETYYEIEFLDTQSIKIAEKRNIRNGSVRDDYSKHICGITCKGNASSRHPILNKKAFKRWYSMIERCYNVNAKMYPSYGGKGIYVDERWLCFENYLNDIVLISGFDYDKYISGEIQLDKDMLFDNNMIYKKDACCFVSRTKNAKYQPSKQKEFLAIDPNGNKYIFNNQNECARQFKLTARTIGKVLNGELKNHHGWTFKYVNN